MSNLNNVLALPDEIFSRVFAHSPHNQAWPLVSKQAREVLARTKPTTHVTCKDILHYPYDYSVLKNAQRQVARIKRTSQFFTITGLTFIRDYDPRPVHDGAPVLTHEDWNEIFESCPQLDYLDFSKSQKFIRLTSHFANNLGYALQCKPQIKLTYLNLYDLELSLSDMIKFFDFLKNTGSFATLKTLELGKNYFSTAFSDWGDKFENFIEKYKELPALESLSFKNGYFQPDWAPNMKALIEHMGSSKLKFLSLKNLLIVHEREGVQAEKIWLPLLEALENGQFSQLKKLDIRLNDLGRREIMQPKFQALEQKRGVLILKNSSYCT